MVKKVKAPDERGWEELEPQIRPEFAAEIDATIKNGKFIKVKDFAEEYGQK
jgi:hypothetical protein